MEKKKKTNFGPDFAPNLVPKTFSEVLPLLDVKRYKLWSYLIWVKLEKMAKKN